MVYIHQEMAIKIPWTVHLAPLSSIIEKNLIFTSEDIQPWAKETCALQIRILPKLLLQQIGNYVVIWEKIKKKYTCNAETILKKDEWLKQGCNISCVCIYSTKWTLESMTQIIQAKVPLSFQLYGYFKQYTFLGLKFLAGANLHLFYSSSAVFYLKKWEGKFLNS